MLERDQPLNDADRQYYERLVATVRADTEHVGSVTDLWSDPTTRVAAQSADGRAVTARMRLSGMIGTSQANDSVSALRDTIRQLEPPQGLRVYVTGPGATIPSDEFMAIDRQMLHIIIATVGLILVLLLLVYRSPVGAAIPLMSVGAALAVARPIVAALGDAGLVEVSLFSVAMLAAMMLGAGTDYAIFLMGRYREGRGRGLPPDGSLLGAYRGRRPGDRGISPHGRGGVGLPELRAGGRVPQHRNPLCNRHSGGNAGIADLDTRVDRSRRTPWLARAPPFPRSPAGGGVSE